MTGTRQTFEVVGGIEQSRLGGAEERVLGFNASHGTEGIDDGRGHRLFQVA